MTKGTLAASYLLFISFYLFTFCISSSLQTQIIVKTLLLLIQLFRWRKACHRKTHLSLWGLRFRFPFHRAPFTHVLNYSISPLILPLFWKISLIISSKVRWYWSFCLWEIYFSVLQLQSIWGKPGGWYWLPFCVCLHSLMAEVRVYSCVNVIVGFTILFLFFCVFFLSLNSFNCLVLCVLWVIHVCSAIMQFPFHLQG